MPGKAETELAILLRLRDHLTKEIKRAQKGVDDFGDKAERAGKRGTSAFKEMRSSFIKFAALIGGFRFLKGIVGDAMDFRQAMSEVSTIVDTSIVNMDDLARAVRELAVAQGENQEVVAKGLYQAISAGITDTGEALRLLAQAGQLAKAGLSTTEEAVNLLTSALNAYNLETTEAARVADIFFKAVEKGKLTIPELAQSFSRAAPLAATLGVSLEELVAAVAALTVGGAPVAEAFTGIRAILSAFLRQAKDIDALFRDRLGESFTLTTLAADGFERTLQKLVRATGGNRQELRNLFVEVEAVNAIFALTGGQSDALVDSLRAMENSAGAAGAAFEKRMADPAERITRLANAAKVAFSELGEGLLLTMADGARAFGEGEDAAANLREAIKTLEPVVKAIGLVFSLMATGIAATATAAVGMLDLFLRFQTFTPAGQAFLRALGLDPGDLDAVSAATDKLLVGLDTLAGVNERLAKDIVGLGAAEDNTTDRITEGTDAAKQASEALRGLASAYSEAAGGAGDLAAISSGTIDAGSFLAARQSLEKLTQRTPEEQRVAIDALTEARRAEISQLVKKLGLDQRDAVLLLGLNQRIRDEGLARIDAAEATKRQREEMQAARDAYKENVRLIKEHALAFQGADAFIRSGANELTAFAMGAKSAKDAFRDFARAFMADILRMIIQAQLLRATMAALGAFGIPQGAIAQFFGVASAKGNVFADGNVVPFQQGGVIQRPTIAPLAAMGERGPEAVMPLRRTTEGRLGVEVAGGAGGTINLNIGFLDTDGADGWLVKRRDTLVAMIREAMFSDPGLRSDVGL